MSLESRIQTQLANFSQQTPETTRNNILGAIQEFSASFNRDATIKVGDQFPSFRLPNAVGKEVSSEDLLAQGPILVVFYRGEWCPICNLTIAALQERCDEVKAKGVTLVAISPELPNGNLTMTEKHALKFPVLSDKGNKLAHQLGTVYALPDTTRSILKERGDDLEVKNGDDSWVVPVPASFLVDQKGIVRNSHIEPNYTKRLEPSEALDWINALQG